MGEQTTTKPEYVVACLRHRERRSIGKACLIAVVALPVVIIEGALLGLILYPFGPFELHIPWYWWLLCCVAGVILHSWLLDGDANSSDTLSDATWSTQMTTPGEHLLLGFRTAGYASGNSSVVNSILTELLQIGPRSLRESIKTLVVAMTVTSRSRVRAGRILQRMMTVDHGCTVDALLEQSEQADDLTPPLDYLVFFDWIGYAKEKQHVWLSGESRSLLEPLVTIRD